MESAPPPAPSKAPRPVLEAVASRVRELTRDPEPTQHAIRQAVEHINEIVVALQQLLDQMEEVLELTELADRQKSADEHEIESLRRALRQIQRPRFERQREEEFRPRDEDRRRREPERPRPEEESRHREEEPRDTEPQPEELPPQQ